MQRVLTIFLVAIVCFACSKRQETAVTTTAASTTAQTATFVRIDNDRHHREMGATKPVASNDTALGRAENRRVELAKS